MKTNQLQFYLIQLVLLLSFNYLYSQFNVQFQDPKSPEAYLFEKYGDVPLSHYTGRPNFSVPLYEINHGEINIPLSLRYTSNGIRIDEEATRVGLGWYFGTGMVSQIIQGKDDLDELYEIKTPDFYQPPYPQYVLRHYPGYYMDNPVNPADPYDPIRLNMASTVPDANSYSMVRVQSEGGLSTAAGGSNTILFPYNGDIFTQFGAIQDYLDVERDVFKANFFGHDLIFTIASSGNISGTNINYGDIRVLNRDNYRISKEYDNDESRYKWVIVDPNGITYEFAEKLITLQTHPGVDTSLNFSSTLNNNQTSGYSTFTELSGLDVHNYNVNASRSRLWKITKIKDTKGNEVVFEYESLPQIQSKPAASGKVDFIDNNNHIEAGYGSGPWGPIHFDGPLVDDNTTLIPSGLNIRVDRNYSSQHQQKSCIKRISFGNSKIEFSLSDRLDIPYDKKIDSLQVFYNNENIETTSLDYSYFNSSNPEDDQKRLKLDGIDVNGKNYAFGYVSDQLPNKNSFSFDHWGLYNGALNQTFVNDPFRLFQDSSQIPGWGVKSLIPQIDGLANRSAHPENAKVGLLNSISYPTGGRSEIEYELNTFDNIFFPNFDNKLNFDGNSYQVDYDQTESQGYGLRVKSITSYTKNNDISTKKTYAYQGGKHIPPFVFINHDNLREVKLDVTLDGGGAYAQKRTSSGSKLTSYFSNGFQNSILGNGDFVGYDMVTEKLENPQGDTLGKTVFYFTNEADKSAREVFGQGGTVPQAYYDKFGYSIRSTDVDNGSLTRREDYNEGGDLVMKTEKTYKTVVPFHFTNMGPNYSTYNVKCIPLGSWGFGDVGSGGGGGASPYIDIYKEYMFYYYPLKQSKTLLDKERTTEYFNNGARSTFTETIYDYNSNYLTIQKLNKDQFGNIFHEETTQYPYSTPLSGNNFSTVNGSGGTHHILNKPMNITIRKNGQTDRFYQYSYSDEYKQADLVKEYPKGIIDDSNKREISYDSYDSNGNLLEYRIEGMKHSIIWGYGKRYPIAKIVNGSNFQFQSHINGLQQKSDQDNDNCREPLCKEEILRQALQDLRNDPNLSNAQITTYTYDPLIGITSITDPKGQTVYYEYDDFNRLEHVRDQDGNILSKNKYHYQTQN